VTLRAALLFALLTLPAVNAQQTPTHLKEIPESRSFRVSTYIFADGPALVIESKCRCVKIDTQDESLVIHEDNSVSWGEGFAIHDAEEARLVVFLVDAIVRVAEPSKGYEHWQDLLREMSK